MRLIILLLILPFLKPPLIEAKDYRVYSSFSFQHFFAKIQETKERENSLNIELDTELVYKNLKIEGCPIARYVLSKGEDHYRFKKASIAYLINENIYISLGRQPVIWGVGRFQNPTNFLKKLKFLQKQQQPEVMEEGIDSALLTFSHNDTSLENGLFFSKFLKETDAYASQLKTLLFNWDVSLCFYRHLKDKESKFGFNLEGDLKGFCNLYSEAAFSKNVSQWLIGGSKLLSIDSQTGVSIEYFLGDKRKSIFSLQLNSSSSEEISGFLILSYDVKEKHTYLMPKISLFLIKNAEVILAPFFCFGQERPFDYKITGEVKYWLR